MLFPGGAWEAGVALMLGAGIAGDGRGGLVSPSLKCVAGAPGWHFKGYGEKLLLFCC